MINLSYRYRRYMKKKRLSLFLALLCVISLLSGCGGKEETKENASTKDTTPVVLNEVAHSIFYAPMKKDILQKKALT